MVIICFYDLITNALKEIVDEKRLNNIDINNNDKYNKYNRYKKFTQQVQQAQ